MRPAGPAGGQDANAPVRAVPMPGSTRPAGSTPLPRVVRLSGAARLPGSARAVAMLVGGAVTVLVLALAARTPTAFVGTGGGTGPLHSPPTSAARSSAPRSPVTRRPHLPPPVTGHLSAVLGTVLLVLFAMLLLALLVLAVRALWRNRPRPVALPPEPPWQPLPDLPASIRADASAQEALLRTGSPRNAIVACWVRLEDLCSQAGVEPEPAETSAELAARVLARAGEAGPAAARDVAAPITELAALYREARFSSHPMGEPARAAAREALRRLHHELEPAMQRQ